MTHASADDLAPALVITRHGTVELRDMPSGIPGPGEMLIEVLYSGVSVGTEMLAAHGKFDAFGPPPFVAGYQAVGRVVACGEGVGQEFSPGTLVASFQKGSHRRYLVVTSALSHVLTGSALTDCAMFVQPCVGANALNRASVTAGESVLVIGQGLIGQSTALQARMRGAIVIGADISQPRLDLATKRCIDIAVNSAEEDLEGAVKRVFPDGVDVVIESTGNAALIDDGMKCLKDQGRFVFEGYYPGQLSFSYAEAHRKQITGVFPWFIGPPETRAEVLASIESGELLLGELISDVVAWTGAQAIYQGLIDGGNRDINGLVISWTEQ